MAALQANTEFAHALWQPDPIVESEVDMEPHLQLLATLELPAEDGEPMESNWHRSALNLLIDIVQAHWRDRTDYFAGGNMFIYFSIEQVRRKFYRGPDFFVVKHVDGTRRRDSWVIWEEDGRYPNVIVELASPSTVRTDLGLKKTLYEQTFRTAEYFCYNPANGQLRGWQLVRDAYMELEPNPQGWLWSQESELWLGGWDGEFQGQQERWVRMYAADGQLVLTRGISRTTGGVRCTARRTACRKTPCVRHRRRIEH